MKKLQVLIGCYVFILASSIIITSCCTNPDTFRILGEGELKAIDIESRKEVSEITGPFIISNDFEQELVSVNISPILINSAYATTCEVLYENAIVNNSLSLSVDKAITIEGVVFEAGSNILESNLVVGEYYEGSFEAYFFDSTLDEVIFDNDSHIFTFQAMDVNGLEYTNTTTVMINL